MRRNFFEHRGHFCFRIFLISSHWHQSKGGTFFALFIYLFFFLFKLHKIILPFIFNSIAYFISSSNVFQLFLLIPLSIFYFVFYFYSAIFWGISFYFCDISISFSSYFSYFVSSFSYFFSFSKWIPLNRPLLLSISIFLLVLHYIRLSHFDLFLCFVNYNVPVLFISFIISDSYAMSCH